MSEFHILYPSLTKMSALSGFFKFQHLSASSKDYTSLFFIYCILISVTSVCIIASSIYFAVTVDMFNARIIGLASAEFLSVFSSVYFMVHSKQIYLLIKDFHSLMKIFTEDDLFRKGSENVIFHRAAKLDTVLKFFLITYVSLPVCTALFTYVNHLTFGATDMLYPVAFDVHNHPFLYVVTLFLQCTTALVTSGRLVSSSAFFFTMLFHLNLCLKQLRFSSKYIFQNIDKQLFQHDVKENEILFVQYLSAEPLYSYNKNRLATDKRYHNIVEVDICTSSTARFREWLKVHKVILW